MTSVLIDTNLLLLLVVGTWDAEQVPRFKRTAQFTPRDFRLLTDELARYPERLTTASILTEVSNLLGNAHELIAPALVSVCAPMIDRQPDKRQSMDDQSFDRLGFSDACILNAVDDDTTVLTDDLQLYLELLNRGHAAENFNHIRGRRI